MPHPQKIIFIIYSYAHMIVFCSKMHPKQIRESQTETYVYQLSWNKVSLALLKQVISDWTQFWYVKRDREIIQVKIVVF